MGGKTKALIIAGVLALLIAFGVVSSCAGWEAADEAGPQGVAEQPAQPEADGTGAAEGRDDASTPSSDADAGADVQADAGADVKAGDGAEASTGVDADAETDADGTPGEDGKAAALPADVTVLSPGQHAKVGQWVKATDNLAVSVLAVEKGPYDHWGDTPTVKVTVGMRSLTDGSVTVKPFNWDADTAAGTRVDGLLWVDDESGETIAEPFGITRISPHATFKGAVYFAGDALASVLYEPYWMVSDEEDFIVFDV